MLTVVTEDGSRREADDLDQLVAFYDYPAEHWIHLRASNPIESTFATVRHRTRVTEGPGSLAAALAMAFSAEPNPVPARSSASRSQAGPRRGPQQRLTEPPPTNQ